MVTPSYDIGDTRRLQVTFKDIDLVVADPTTIDFKMLEPDGVLTLYTVPNANVIKASTGIYYVDWLFTKLGRHKAEFIGTGAVAQVVPYENYIKRSNV
ncbi:MAG: hypothetical protein IIA70_04105 [Proteobacteria bacterium]|nr:hypothetical protein [Pseudomonadota bacterium]